MRIAAVFSSVQFVFARIVKRCKEKQLAEAVMSTDGAHDIRLRESCNAGHELLVHAGFPRLYWSLA